MGTIASIISAAATVALVLIQLFSHGPKIPAPMPNVPGKSTEQLREEAQRYLGVDSINHFNFAFCGGAGVGKSSLINAVRWLNDTDPDAAPVGNIETTQHISSYKVPGYPHVVLWDLPGAGTPTHKAETYFMDKKLYAFDFLLIMTGNRVTETDIALAKDSVEANVPVAFVRSKSDADLRNEHEACDCDLTELKRTFTTSAYLHTYAVNCLVVYKSYQFSSSVQRFFG